MARKLTEKLSETLFAIVMLVHENKGVFPTQARLAKALNLNPETARKRLDALKKKDGLIVEKDGSLELHENLCTLPTSAIFLLTIYDHKSARIDKENLIATLLQNPAFQKNYDFDAVLKKAEQLGYIDTASPRPDLIKPLKKIDHLEFYLRKLSALKVDDFHLKS